MPAANLNQLWARALIAALCEGGVREAVICPGSRSTPLALACADHPGLRSWSVIDERSAGFFALGMAKQSGAPVIVVATSGTAPAHFYPAVIEAAHAHLPLVVLSADRPWELHGFGAPQTIDQEALFGRYARASLSLGLPEESPAVLGHLQAAVSRALQLATSAPRGPIHLNVPFREPLAPTPDGVTRAGSPNPGRRALQLRAEALPSESDLAEVRSLLERTERGLIVCGPRDADDRFGDAVLRLAQATGHPVFAEAASQVRSARLGASVITRYDALLRNTAFAKAHRPDVVLRFGGGITSKRLQAFLDDCGAETILVSDDGSVFDPAHRASRVLVGDARAVAARLVPAAPRASTGWSARFDEAQARAEAALEAALARTEALSEPRLAREVAAALPPGAQLFVSSSMPIRDVDGFGAATPGVRVLSNRGVNGIDGVIASALGAAASAGRPTALLIGDLAFLHDLGSLLIALRSEVPITIVVANNDGGGIFSFLPIAKFPEHFETLFGTPHGLSFGKAAELYGARYARPSSVAELRRELRAGLERGVSIVEVVTDRAENVALHERLGTELAAAVGEGPWR